MEFPAASLHGRHFLKDAASAILRKQLLPGTIEIPQVVFSFIFAGENKEKQHEHCGVREDATFGARRLFLAKSGYRKRYEKINLSRASNFSSFTHSVRRSWSSVLAVLSELLPFFLKVVSLRLGELIVPA